MSAVQAIESEVDILTRIFEGGVGRITPEMARFILGLDFNDRDRVRMHELTARNQDDALTPIEKEELTALVNAGSMLSILQSRARRALKSKRDVPPGS